MEFAHSRQGSGAPLVLLHGLGGTQRIWDPVIERLAEEREVIALDMPGFGSSSSLGSGTPPSAANLGAAVSSFCSAIGLERPHFAGNSLGAWASLEIAKRGGAASVCGLSPAGLWKKPLGVSARDRRAVAMRIRPLVELVSRSSRARAAMLRNTLVHPERVPRDVGIELILGWFAAPAYEAANHEMRLNAFEHEDAIEVPVTIAWGELDKVVGPPSHERLPPGARFLVLPGCGHVPTWDDPDLVSHLVLETSG